MSLKLSWIAVSEARELPAKAACGPSANFLAHAKKSLVTGVMRLDSPTLCTSLDDHIRQYPPVRESLALVLALAPSKSGNPSGRPKIPADVIELARAASPEAIETLISIMKNKNVPAAARVAAAEKILDRAWGKAAQAITGKDGEGPAIIEVRWKEPGEIISNGRPLGGFAPKEPGEEDGRVH
jgi:hypothetical protein